MFYQVLALIFLLFLSMFSMAKSESITLHFVGKVIEESCRLIPSGQQVDIQCRYKGEQRQWQQALTASVPLPNRSGNRTFYWIDKEAGLAMLTVSYH